MTVDQELVTKARSVGEGVIAMNAVAIDAESRFPAENVKALHDAGLMAVFLPRALGGHDATVQTYGAIAATLAEYCTSTAMLWAMHAQQLISLQDHASDTHLEWLERVGRDGCLIGSVTTDTKGGADLFSTGDALVVEGDKIRVHRTAPIVTGGMHAGFYLVTMRASPDAPPTNTRLVLVQHGDGEIVERGGWNALGMRGTHSVPMQFDVLVDQARVLAVPFSELAKQTLVPAGHVGWASCWFGAVRGAAARLQEALRARHLKRPSGNDVVFERLARVRLNLDLLESMIERVAIQADQFRQARQTDGSAGHVDPVLANNLKLAGSKLAFDTIDQLVEIAGMKDGYLRYGGLGLERIFRDLRSASLMFHNDRLLQANGRLILVGAAGLMGLGDRPAGDRQ